MSAGTYQSLDIEESELFLNETAQKSDNQTTGHNFRKYGMAISAIIAVLLVIQVIHSYYFGVGVVLGDCSEDSLRIYPTNEICRAGTKTAPLPYSTLQLPSTNYDTCGKKITLYQTHDLTKRHDMVKRVILLQHGNLRDANEYFCQAIQTLQSLQNTINMDEYAIIVPQFLIENDVIFNNGNYSTLS